jgi:CheY-like chemotaxis protein
LLEVSVSKKTHLQLELEPSLPACQGDATQVRQVLMNLVLNAAEAIGDRVGHLTIRTGRHEATHEDMAAMAFRETAAEGEYVFFEVVDDGGGMDAATVARIFDPFYTTKFTGRGLGLAAVLGIVRGHKGAIKVYSQVNKGTAFKIFFPVMDQNGSRAARPRNRVRGNTLGRVLVVDDEDTVRMVAAKILKSAGCEIVTARDGLEALEIFRRSEEPFDLVLMDLTMPRMDGEEAFRGLRKIDAGIRVILMSGFSEQETLGRFAGQGVVGFVPKPFTADILIGKVKELLAQETEAPT